MRCAVSTLPIAVLALGACSSGRPISAAPDAAPADAGPVSDDAEPEPEADAAVACWLSPLDDMPGADGLSEGFDAGSKEWRIVFDVDPAGDYRGSVILREGHGLFADGVIAGKYDIYGADARYESCSLCVAVSSREGVVEGDGHRFFAQAGTLHLESVDAAAGTIEGYLVGLDFAGFELSEQGGAYCTDSSECGRTSCGLLTCKIQHLRPDLCGFSIGRLNF